jgi:Putative auto-transporter adhesin, head GIN domain
MKKTFIFIATFVVTLTIFSTTNAQNAPAKTVEKKAKKGNWSWGKKRADGSWTVGYNSNGGEPERVVGTGESVVDVRKKRDFTGVISDIPMDIIVRQSPIFKVSIEGQKNISDLIITKIEEGNLVISLKYGYIIENLDQLTIQVEAPIFTYFGVTNKGEIRIDGALVGGNLEIISSGLGSFNSTQVQYGAVKVRVSGRGDVNLSGISERTDLAMSGSGTLKTDNLSAKLARCKVSGTGKIFCLVTDELDASISGSGTIQYTGNPPKIKKGGSGSRNIEAL